MKSGILYLLPVGLGGEHLERVLPSYNMELLNSIDYFVVENLRTARRFLRKAGYHGSLDDHVFGLLNEHTHEEELPGLLQPIRDGRDGGIMSEAGVPCVADPGSRLVMTAQQLGIRVRPLTGPSSIILALMASGMNGQSFIFHGYLPVKAAALRPAIIDMEKDVLQSGRTNIFIEAPYRNQRLLDELLKTCRAETLLCIATEISTGAEWIRTRSISGWKKAVPEINKKNAVFLLGSG